MPECALIYTSVDCNYYVTFVTITLQACIEYMAIGGNPSLSTLIFVCMYSLLSRSTGPLHLTQYYTVHSITIIKSLWGLRNFALEIDCRTNAESTSSLIYVLI